jgi:hypothetical protein
VIVHVLDRSKMASSLSPKNRVSPVSVNDQHFSVKKIALQWGHLVDTQMSFLSRFLTGFSKVQVKINRDGKAW